MAYNLNTFLKPISDDNNNVLIYNENGELVYTLNPFSVTNIQVRGNIITISIKSGRTILLDFLNTNISKDALPILQNRIFTLSEKTPNFIDKQISNWVYNQGLSSSNGSQGPIGPTGGYIIESSPIFYGTVSIIGTLSMSGNIIPDLDYTWDLGSPSKRWNNIYVKDALVASQSLYLGDFKISIGNDGMSMPSNLVPSTSSNFNIGSTLSRWNNIYLNEIDAIGDINLPEGKNLYSGGLRFSSRINGTSNDLLEVKDIGYYFVLTTQKYLSFERGITVIISNGLEDFYVDTDYFDDATAAVMFAIVDSYDETTGLMGVYVERPIGLGRTASSWTINISGRQTTLELGTTASYEELTITGTTNLQQVVELLTTATATGLSPSTYDLNFDDGSIFYIEPEGDNFYANYINVPTTDNTIISTTLIISQSSTAYIPNNVIINGDLVTISWANAELPTGNPNQTDIVGFTMVRRGATWSSVFGQLSTFAPI